MKAQKTANRKPKIKNSLPRAGLTDFARAHEDAEVTFEFAQVARERDRTAGRERDARDGVFAFAQERFELGGVAPGARGDAFGDLRAGRGRGKARVARERASRPLVNVFDCQVV